ncbi:ATP-binding protein [Streptomyces sp. NPDC002520]
MLGTVWASGEGASAAGRRGTGGLIGRGQETTALREGLARGRLVTVTGAAGVGKSGLAASVAVPGPGGPWGRVIHVPCPGAPAATGTLAARVAEALTGHRPDGDDETTARLVPAADPSPRPTLLFLDDADPVRTECAGLVQRLLMEAPGLRVLVTCRQALGLGDERVVRLAPLGAEPAAELFLARARAVVPGFRAERDELACVTRICRLVEGLPLAVELAAAQLARDPSVHALAERLEHGQCWLAAPGPALRRHRSLRSAVGAAHLLLDRPARVVWSRSSVFAGAFTEPTAAYLCSGAGVAPHQVSACLARLAAAGVLETVGESGGVRPPRYRMTRAARDFGAERLRAAGEFPVALERHVLHCRRLAEVAEDLWNTGNQRQAARLVQDEEEDLTALVESVLARPDAPAEHVAAALGAVVDLWFWWAVHGHAEEGRAHLARLLPRHTADDPLAARARWLAAWLHAPGDLATARTLLGEVWPAAVLAGDDALIGRVAHVQGLLAWEQGDARTAVECLRQAADIVPVYAPGGPAASVSLAALAIVQAPLAPGAARRSARRALAHPGVREDAWATALARYARACVDHHQGHSGRARHRAGRALAALDTGAVLPGVLRTPDVPDMPQVRAALRRLLADIESGTRTGLPVPDAVPAPRTGTAAPVYAASPVRG